MSLARELCLLEVSVARELCLLPARQRLPQMETQSANELRKREKRLEARVELVFLRPSPLPFLARRASGC